MFTANPLIKIKRTGIFFPIGSAIANSFYALLPMEIKAKMGLAEKLSH